MSPVVSSDTRSLAQKLFIDLSPGIFQSYGAVEYQMSGGGIFVDIEITDTLELQIRERGHVGHVLLYIACLLYTSPSPRDS